MRNRNDIKRNPYKSSLYSNYKAGPSGKHKVVKTELPNYLLNIRNGIGKLMEWSGVSNIFQKKDRDLLKLKSGQRNSEKRVWKNFKRR